MRILDILDKLHSNDSFATERHSGLVPLLTVALMRTIAPAVSHVPHQVWPFAKKKEKKWMMSPGILEIFEVTRRPVLN